ncbi:poxin-like [Colias croceus]|uniref:poxin-like n=1 Tax=Colias crocea TaxID=72248 RepID=UPI001E27F3A7|nr:poxin-like [Colias croceus]XP_045503705.1 poxin-like [Colias croceus]XP_045503706.1 poxin-like [Colias croceus]
MSSRTVLNEQYKGLVEQLSIPAEVAERGGRRCARSGTTMAIHCCSPEEIAERAQTTHHYCDVFTDDVLAPLGELAYVRLDADTAEKVFLNRSKRILLVSSDGHLALWRCAPTFESANVYVAGSPIVDKSGAIVSVVTAKRGNHYAISNAEGEGGYFETSAPWEIHDIDDAKFAYADKKFNTREELREYISSLPPADLSSPPRPLLLRGKHPRVALVAQNGRQIVHIYLSGVLTNDIEYL